MGDWLESIVPAEKHFAEDAADILVVDAFSSLFEPIKGCDRAFLVDDFRVFLRKIADLDLMSIFDPASIGNEDPGEHLEKSGFSLTIVTDHPDFLTFSDFTGKIADDLFFIVTFAKVFYFKDDLARGFLRWIKANIGALDIGFFEFLRL